MNTIQILFLVFSLTSIAHIIFIVLKKEWARRISKCLLLPLLLAAYFAGGTYTFIFPVFALVLGWLGDILLIRADKKNCFLLGLASFLLGHLFYIITFISILGFFGFNGSGKFDLPAAALFSPPAIVLGVVVFRLIKPAKDLYVPVIIYMIVLVTMTLFGAQVFLFNHGFAGLLIVSGCLCFMVSDTILAYYTFRTLKISGSVFLMTYYILAQTEIILGIMLLKSASL